MDDDRKVDQPRVRAPVFQAPQFLAPEFPPPHAKPASAEPPSTELSGTGPASTWPAGDRVDADADQPHEDLPRDNSAGGPAAAREASAAKATGKTTAKAPVKKATAARKATTAKKAPAAKAAAKTTTKEAKTTTKASGTPATKASPPPDLPDHVGKDARFWTQFWTRIRTSPEYTMELLALAAVTELGPQARDWVAEMRAAYPAATPEGLAHLATNQHLRLSAAAALAGLATGLVGGAVEAAGVAWVQARLALRLAAVYGRDPADPERAVDLLVLIRVHPDADAARDALAAATSAVPTAAVPTGDMPTSDASSEGIDRLVPLLSGHGGAWGVRRAVARLLPGSGALLALCGTTSDTQRLAARATSHFRAARAG